VIQGETAGKADMAYAYLNQAKYQEEADYDLETGSKHEQLGHHIQLARKAVAHLHTS
jgi:uncharacterized protein (DUF885 family)